MLGASLFRTESRLSHFREEYAARDDGAWLVWVDVEGGNGRHPDVQKDPDPDAAMPGDDDGGTAEPVEQHVIPPPFPKSQGCAATAAAGNRIDRLNWRVA